MTELATFQYEGFQLRARNEDDENIVVSADVAKILGYADQASMTRYLDDDEKGLSFWQTPGGRQQLAHLTEAGLYAAIMRSTSDRAKPFRRWVTHEVLPSIRKRGAYLTPEAAEAALTDPDFIIRLATELKSERAARVSLEAEKRELEPKARFADAVSTSKSSIRVGDLAKIMEANGANIGQNRLFDLLRERGYLMRDGASRNMPTQRSMELGLFEIKETAVTHSDGTVRTQITPKVTGKDQTYLLSRLLPELAAV